MKFTSILAIFFTVTAAIAAPLAAENLNAEQLAELEAREADASLSSFEADITAPIQTRALTRAQCKRACDKGADAVEAFCRRLPKLDLRTRAACWAASTAAQSPLGQRACVAFCDAWF